MSKHKIGILHIQEGEWLVRAPYGVHDKISVTTAPDQATAHRLLADKYLKCAAEHYGKAVWLAGVEIQNENS